MGFGFDIKCLSIGHKSSREQLILNERASGEEASFCSIILASCASAQSLTGYQKRTTQILRESHVYSIDNFVAF